MFRYQFNFSDFLTEFFIFVGIFSAWLSYRFVKRKNQGKEKESWVVYAYVYAVSFCLSLLSFGVLLGVAKSVYDYATLPKYQAEIIDYETTIQDYSVTKNGRTRTEQREMHRPLVYFDHPKEGGVKIHTDMLSSRLPKIGSTIKIGYEKGMERAIEYSLIKFLLMGGVFLIGLAFFFLIVWAVFYAIGKPTDGIKNIGVKMVSFLVIPIAMLLLLGGMLYGLYHHFTQTDEKLPIWAVCLLVFFSLILFFSFWGYLKGLFLKKETNNRRENRRKNR